MKTSCCTRIKSGFTLIELLIVIAILGIIAAGIVTALNVTGTIGKANLTKAKTFAASIENDLSIDQKGKWSFEETVSPFKDTSGYNNNGLCSGAICPTWKTASQCGLGFGGCLSFDGDDDYIDLPESNFYDFGTGDFTISAWVNAPSGSTTRMIYAKSNNANTNWQLALFVQTGNALMVQFDGGDFGVGGGTVADNTWKHVAVTRQSSAVRLYINGGQVASAISSFNVSSTGNECLGKICTSQPPLAFNGRMDEIAIYNQALTAYQIQHLFAQGLPRHQLAKEVSRY